MIVRSHYHLPYYHWHNHHQSTKEWRLYTKEGGIGDKSFMNNWMFILNKQYTNIRDYTTTNNDIISLVVGNNIWMNNSKSSPLALYSMTGDSARSCECYVLANLRAVLSINY